MSPSERYTDLKRVEHDAKTVLTVGFFDGVHRGHQSVLRKVRNEADRLKARSLMVTFDRPPKAVLLGTSVPLLTTLEEKAALIGSLGISDMVVIPFDHRFAKLEPHEFVESILVDRIGVREIVLGYDHRFGRHGAGDVAAMRELGAAFGFGVQVVEAETLEGIPCSSTRIRHMLTDAGDVETAAAHLNRYYTLVGLVVHGDGRGKRIGFPTANLRPVDEIKVVPATGVYAVFAKLEQEEGWRQGVMNIGYRPTVTEGKELVAEVHIIGLEKDLYGQAVEVAFVRRLRDEKRFENLDTLVRQIRDDLANCIRVLESVNFLD